MFPNHNSIGLFCHLFGHYLQRGGFNERLCFRLAGQQAFNFTAQSLIAVTGLPEKVCAVVLFQLQSRANKLFDPLPAFRFHVNVNVDAVFSKETTP
jgi:hypothetical protein